MKQCVCLVIHVRQSNAFFQMLLPFTRPQLGLQSLAVGRQELGAEVA